MKEWESEENYFNNCIRGAVKQRGLWIGGGGGLSVLIRRDQEVEAGRMKAHKEGVRSPVRITSFLTSQGDSDMTAVQ